MNTNQEPNKQELQVKKEKGEVVYNVAGQEVKLSYQIVRDFLTKGNSNVEDKDLTMFISICKYNQLNPFLNEAYLVKFGQQPAQMIVSKEAMFKRAEEHEKYEGFRAGVIVLRKDEQLELEGAFFLATDKLVGGWCEVFRSDRKYPIISKVQLEEYDKKQSTWNEKKSTMISKVAKVQALREAFPTQLGAMYTQEEQNTIDIDHEEIKKEIDKKANSKKLEATDVDYTELLPTQVIDETPKSDANPKTGKPELDF